METAVWKEARSVEKKKREDETVISVTGLANQLRNR